jgi:DnaK suppressor protein
MERKKLRKYRQALEAKRAALREKAARNARQIRRGPGDGGGDSVDDALENYNREFLFSLSALDRATLRQIDEALSRIDEGTYGYCEMSGEPISEARLKAIPWARYTLECQEELERERRARGEAGSGSPEDSVAS